MKQAIYNMFFPALLMVIALAAGGCSERSLLRDQYMGKRWLQPDAVVRPVARDQFGRPILSPAEQRRLDDQAKK